MKTKMMTIATKAAAAIIVAATVMSVGTKVVRADETNTEVVECVETNEAETPAAPEVEGQGDIIDDQFVYVEGQGDVIDDEFAFVEGQGDVIDDEFAVVPEEEAQPIAETVVETPVVEAPVVEAPVAEAPVAETPVAETPAASEVEGQGDVIDDEFAFVEGQGDVIDDEFAAIPDQAKSTVETNTETKKTTKTTTKKVVAPAVDMSLSNTFFGYHGKEVDYKNLVNGKFYLMQIPKTAGIPTFKYRVVKILGSYTNKGVVFDDVMVKYNQYKCSGRLEYKNRKTQVNENLLNLTPNHFFEITDDILAKK